jgi:hypothetical protein
MPSLRPCVERQHPALALGHAAERMRGLGGEARDLDRARPAMRGLEHAVDEEQARAFNIEEEAAGS